MTITNTVTEVKTTDLPTLAVSDLKTVKWVGDTHYFQQAYKKSVTKYNHYRTWPVARWIFAAVELVVLSVAMFVQQLPWPASVVSAVYKFDGMMENGLNFTYNKLDWWWDIFMVRSIRLRDSLENLIDGFLSFGFYCILLLGNLWEFYVSFFKLILIPYIWLYRIITLGGPKQPTSPIEKQTEDITENVDITKKLEPSMEDISESSDYESDVSAVSESWSMGLLNKHGQGFNRVQTSVTAEGKLRAVMQRRAANQLSVMRKHSARFSLGVASYIKEFWEPRMRPAVEAVYEVIQAIAKKFGLIHVLENAKKKIAYYPFIEKQLILIVYLMVFPLNAYSGLTKRTRSRRTRSVRSESMRRRLAASKVNVPVPLLPTERNRSAEMITEELPVPPVCSVKYCEETDPYCNRDSALTSSVEDNLTSDSNDIFFKKTMKTNSGSPDSQPSVQSYSQTNGGAEYRIKLRIDEEQETTSLLTSSLKQTNNAGSRSPQLPRIKLNNLKSDIPDTAFLLSPRHRRRNRNRLMMEQRLFLSEEHMLQSPEFVSKGPNFEGSSSMCKGRKLDKKRKISFTL